MTDADNLEKNEKLKLDNWRNQKINLLNVFGNIKEEEKEPNLQKIEEASREGKNLNLEIISSSFEPKGLVLKITPFGYEKSLRGVNDGITYFGYEEKENNNNVRNIF